MNDSVAGALDTGSMTGLLQAGGAVMWIIGGLSVIALAIVLVKIAEFAQTGVWRRTGARRALDAWRAGRAEDAVVAAEAERGPVAEILVIALRGRASPTVEDATVREEVARHGAALLERLRTGLRPLELIGTLAPLLGLLGTVLGMIDAFRALEAAGSRVDPAVLSGGIWVALLTTAAGLSVAIPAVAAHVWLERQVERVHHAMQDAATRVFTRDINVRIESTATGSPDAPSLARVAEAGRAD